MSVNKKNAFIQLSKPSNDGNGLFWDGRYCLLYKNFANLDLKVFVKLALPLKNWFCQKSNTVFVHKL